MKIKHTTGVRKRAPVLLCMAKNDFVWYNIEKTGGHAAMNAVSRTLCIPLCGKAKSKWPACNMAMRARVFGDRTAWAAR